MNINEAIRLLDGCDKDGNVNVVSIKFVKHNRTTGKGGAIRTIARAQLNTRLQGKDKTQWRTIDVLDLDETVPNRRIKKIHLDLILSINGQTLI